MALTWVKIIKGYAGEHGILVKGDTCNLSPELIKKLPKGTCKSTCAPWNKNKDPNLAKIKAAQAKVDEASNSLATLKKELVDSELLVTENVERIESTLTDIDKNNANIETKKEKIEKLQKGLDKSKAKANDKNQIKNLLKEIDEHKTFSGLTSLYKVAEDACLVFNNARVVYQQATIKQAESFLKDAEDKLEETKKKAEEK